MGIQNETRHGIVPIRVRAHGSPEGLSRTIFPELYSTYVATEKAR